ncbi:MAG: hypothetical protein PXZ07_08460 [Candidatus Eremiobacteraeota bacterium]|uniref:Uncharacterized protein n=1 Tax=mine drainage metagenome TaxID=410659 RepID=E6Q0V6_9ZZZZ|nr:hypothetical protein [Candidatus Eremiobacteraeota bacterium]
MSGTSAPGLASAAHAYGHPFAGRRAVIVTKRGKERVLDPLLRLRLGMYSEVLQIEAKPQSSQLDALRGKLRAGAEATPYDSVIVASVGRGALEMVGFYDPRRGIEIIGRALAPASHEFSGDLAIDRRALISAACDDAIAQARLMVPSESPAKHERPPHAGVR